MLKCYRVGGGLYKMLVSPNPLGWGLGTGLDNITSLGGGLHPYFVRNSYKVYSSIVSFILKQTFSEGHFFQMDGFRRALFKQTDSEGHFSNRLIQKGNFLMTEM